MASMFLLAFLISNNLVEMLQILFKCLGIDPDLTKLTLLVRWCDGGFPGGAHVSCVEIKGEHNLYLDSKQVKIKPSASAGES